LAAARSKLINEQLMSVFSDRHPILELENGQLILEKNRHLITSQTDSLQTLEIFQHHTFSDLKQ